MKKVKGSTLIILILSVLLVILGGYIVYDKVFQNEDVVENDKLENDDIDYTYNSLSGIYEKSIDLVYENDSTYKKYYLLALLTDGTFRYCESVQINICYSGNYTISDNIINLYVWFRTSSDMSIFPLKTTYTANIDANNLIVINSENSVDLTKTTDDVATYVYTIDYYLRSHQIYNELS